MRKWYGAPDLVEKEGADAEVDDDDYLGKGIKHIVCLVSSW